MDKILLYMHAGSGNHGCEAIAGTTIRMLKREGAASVILSSNDPEEDRRYSIGGLEKDGAVRLVGEKHIAEHPVAHTAYYGYRLITGDAESFLRYRFRDAIRLAEEGEGKCTAVSIGGDNYCYPELHRDLFLTDGVFRKKGFRTVLMGCSIEPEMIHGLSEDLSGFDRIITRESITYEALIDACSTTDISEEKLSLCPDPAFTLEPVQGEAPAALEEGGIVGINISPMVRDKYGEASAVMDNYIRLIRYILEKTDMSVMLVPHVVRPNSDDRQALSALKEHFAGESRIVSISDRSAGELKYFISRCRFFVGARTHATIAAYSSLVPTLVVGYSVKSRGIAKDLFADEAEGLVLPVQDMKEGGELTRAFSGLVEREDAVKQRLTAIMPEYIERATQIKLT